MVLTHPSVMRKPFLGPWWDSTLLISYVNFYEELQKRKVDTKINFQKNPCVSVSTAQLVTVHYVCSQGVCCLGLLGGMSVI